MKRVEVIREQAAVLRSLADSFDVPSIKEDLLNLATRCDLMAAGIAREISDQLQRPVTELVRKSEPEGADDATAVDGRRPRARAGSLRN